MKKSLLLFAFLGLMVFNVGCNKTPADQKADSDKTKTQADANAMKKDIQTDADAVKAKEDTEAKRLDEYDKADKK